MWCINKGKKPTPPPHGPPIEYPIRGTTEEEREFSFIQMYVGLLVRDGAEHGSVRSEAEIEFLNRVVERLNTAAATNEALRTYWDYRNRR